MNRIRTGTYVLAGPPPASSGPRQGRSVPAWRAAAPASQVRLRGETCSTARASSPLMATVVVRPPRPSNPAATRAASAEWQAGDDAPAPAAAKHD
jgi:hypothetical protein